MIIPFEMLAEETLANLIEEFVSRDGTDNGYDEPLSARVEKIKCRLKSGEIVIVFDQERQSPNILPKEIVTQLQNQAEFREIE